MSTRSRTIGFAGLWLALPLLACAGAASAPGGHAESRNLYGVGVRIVVPGGDPVLAEAACDQGFRAAENVAAKLLADHPGSEIDLLAKVPSRLWVEISPETHAALALGARIAVETDGAYDYTDPVLRQLWGLREGGTPHRPRDFEIDMILRRVDWEDVEVRGDDGLQARRLNRRTEIDLGGVARGAMLDAALARLRALGLSAARASTAHEHAFFGGRADGPWRVDLGISALVLPEGALAVVRPEAAVETASGESIRGPFDPRSGRPVHGVRSVVVRASSAAASAGYASAAFAMAADASAWIESRDDLDAVVALEGEPLWVSPALAASAESRAP